MSVDEPADGGRTGGDERALRRALPWLAVALVALPALLYVGEIGAPLGSDARFLTSGNRFNQDAAGLARLWTEDFFAGGGDAAVSLRSGYYRPLTSTVYWIVHAVAGADPRPYNLLEMLLHGVNSALVLAVLLALSGSALVAAVGSTLFAVHPVHAFAAVEPAALSDVLFPAFYLAAVLAFDRALREEATGRRRLWIGAATAAYAGAVLGKEMGITFPAVAVALVLFRKGRGPRRQTVRALAWTLPAWGVMGAFLVWRFGFLAFPLHDFGYVESHGAAAVAAAGFEGLVIHLSRIVLPTGPTYPELNPSLRNVLGPPWGDPRVWAGVVLVGALAWLALRWRSRPTAAFWAAFLLITFSPLLSVESIARALHPDVILTEERWIYLPSVALFAAAGHGARLLRERAGDAGARAALSLLGLGLVAVLAWESVLHAGRFRDPYAQLRRLYAIPEEDLGRKEVAQRYLMYAQWVSLPAGDLDEAEARAREAWRVVPDSPLTALGLARVLEARGAWEGVRELLEPWHRPSQAALDSVARTNPRVEEDVYRTAPHVALLLGREATVRGDGPAALAFLCEARALGAPPGEVEDALSDAPGAGARSPDALCDPRGA